MTAFSGPVLRSSLDRAAEWAERATRAIHPLLAVAAFSAALLWEGLMFLSPAQAGLPEWVWHLGLAIGLCIAASVPFLLWAYLTVTVFLILGLLGRDVDLPPTGSAIGLAFALAAVGKAVEVLARLSGATMVGVWLYVGLAVVGLGATLAALTRSTKVAVEEAVLALAVSVVGLELAYRFLLK